MIVKDVMTSPAITVDAGTTVKNALRLLDRYRVTSLPVTDAQGQVVGIVSEADLLRDLVRKDTRAHMLPPAQPSDQPRTVGQVMTTLSLAVCADTDLSDAVDLMTSTAVKSLPVLEQGRVVGVVSRSDVVRVLARADEQIEAEVDEFLRSAGVECEVEVGGTLSSHKGVNLPGADTPLAAVDEHDLDWVEFAGGHEIPRPVLTGVSRLIKRVAAGT